MLAYHLFKNLLFTPISRAVFHPWVRGEQNIPEEGGLIMACNHLSYGETFLVPAMITRRMTFPVKAEIFQQKSIGGRIVGWFLKTVGQVPLDRSGGRASADGLSPVQQVLADGGVVGIFPEGTRSPDGRMYKPKTGVAKMALEAGVPILPVGTVGTEFRKGLFGIPVMKRPGIIFGEPLDFSHLADRSGEMKVLRWVTDEVMAAVQQLTGQEYVDVYATRAKFGELKDKDLTPFVRPRPGGGELPPRPAPRAVESTAGAEQPA
ncbi:lysophospholipid acyltransferase family protein [Propionibacteriaceae bacterium G1746]|uniref:lysophospholipid acyltransferase family protein n=1 Tax=Aestuariimicrobium sp. G57 TaxID=3418485 RepID=UPI003C2211A6